MANKTFFTYDEQIDKLEKEKQLIISNPEFAKTTLQKLSYFSLIGSYKDLFKHKTSGNYLHGVTFEEITAFYYFDEELRTLFLLLSVLFRHLLAFFVLSLFQHISTFVVNTK